MDTKLTVTTITDPEDDSLAYAIKDSTGKAIAVVAQEDDAILLAKAPALLEALYLYMRQYPEAPGTYTSAGCHARAITNELSKMDFCPTEENQSGKLSVLSKEIDQEERKAKTEI